MADKYVYTKIAAVGDEPAKLEVAYEAVKKLFTEKDIDEKIQQLTDLMTRNQAQLALWQVRKTEINK